MVSFWKTQLFSLVAGTIALGMFVFNLIRGEGVPACLWVFSAYVWFTSAVVSYLQDRVVLLEKEKERNDGTYELVQELILANKIDREIAKKLEERVKQLEEKK